MRKNKIGATFLCGALLSVAMAAAANTQSEARKPSAIVLPNKVVAGQAASLAVLDASGALLPGVQVEFPGGERITTDATGRATFTAPSLPESARSGLLEARIPDTDLKGTAIVLPPAVDSAESKVGDVPRLISMRDRFVVTGVGFRGEVDATQAWLGEQHALVLAASPLELVILAGPRAEPGPLQLALAVGGQRLAPADVTLVALEISAEKMRLAAKEKGKLRIVLRGTEQRVELEIRNLTPKIVRIGEADVVRVHSTGGPANVVDLTLTGKSPGDFSVAARLIPLPAGLPNSEAARQKLLAARRISPAAWSARLEDMIHRIEYHPQEANKVRDQLEKILATKPEGDFGRLIEEAWRILIGK